MTRRQALGLMSGGIASLATGCGPTRESREWTWRGVLFQSPVEVRIADDSELDGEQIANRITEEIRRAEQAFSLFEPGSEISRLNRTGSLTSPSQEFLDVLRWALELAERSDGIFDPTIQPYWRALWEAGGTSPPPDELRRLSALVDYRQVEANRGLVRFARAGMALTLNAVSQGFAADRVAKSLREAGVTRALVNMGEFVAIGDRSAGRPWKIQIRAGGANGPPEAWTELSDEALAVSSGAGLRFGAGNANHLMHPRGDHVPTERLVAVKAPQATTADGLSTVSGLMDGPSARGLVASYPSATLQVWDRLPG